MSSCILQNEKSIADYHMLTLNLKSLLTNPPPAESVTSLDLSGKPLRNIPLADMQNLGAILGSFNQLTHLNLDQTEIGIFQSSRIKYLFQDLWKCKLKTISLANNQLRISSLSEIRTLGNALGTFAELISLNLDQNFIGGLSPRQIQYLFQPLSNCLKLTTISLSNNDLVLLSSAALHQLGRTLNNIQTDLTLHLDNHGFSQAQLDQFFATFTKINFFSCPNLIPAQQLLLKNRYIQQMRERAQIAYFPLSSQFSSEIMNLIFQYLYSSENYSEDAILNRDVWQAIANGFKSAAASSQRAIPESAGEATAAPSDSVSDLTTSLGNLSLNSQSHDKSDKKSREWLPLHKTKAQAKNDGSHPSSGSLIPVKKTGTRHKKR